MVSAPALPDSLKGLAVHLVGAKGTGMAALAEIFAARGALLSGSDVPDTFYTDAILKSIGVAMREGFDASNVPLNARLVVHSAAYSRDSNPELLEAKRRGIPLLSYPEALGALSRLSISSGIAGVHGKTTTTALAGSVVSALGLPATTLAGSAVSSFGGRSTLIRGDRFFIAETCEYRRHFLSFAPSRIVLTSVEGDHQDFFPTYADILAAFLDYIRLLPRGGELIFCADDPGAVEAATRIAPERNDIVMTPYGTNATGPYRMLSYEGRDGEARFRLAGFEPEFRIRVPGRHIALDACAAIALAFSLLSDGDARVGVPISSPSASQLEATIAAINSFAGSKRRSEILGEAGGILFMDDYGHHPTALRETIRGFKEFWPSRRLVVDFMSHTYSRTKALFSEFAESLDAADVIVMHGIYASARETPDPSVTGRGLFETARDRQPERESHYFEKVVDGLEEIAGLLRPGDLFLTMGAGDNWKLGQALLDRFRSTGGRQ